MAGAENNKSHKNQASSHEVVPGNNGTVKIDAYPLDPGPGDDGRGDPDNEPHVGCRFAVDFYNYDKGDFNANATFQLWPPTGQRQELATKQAFIGEDPPGGGRDLDATLPVDLTSELSKFTPAKQGYHVKLTVHAPYAQGADTKHKVFWIKPCASTADQTATKTTTTVPATTTTTEATSPATTVTTTPTATAGSTSSPEVLTQELTAAPAASSAGGAVPGAMVLGETLERPAPATVGAANIDSVGASRGSVLAFTGSAIRFFVALGLGLLAIGAIALKLGRGRPAGD